MKKSNSYTLYGITHSLYAGRARSYLIKSGTAFRELSSGHKSFKTEVLPESKLATIPVLVTPEGEVIRDGGAIIEHFEKANSRPFQPSTAKQQIVSTLFDLIGTSGLLRPAMHYRWNYLEENSEFLRYHFLHSQPEHPEREAKSEYMMSKMQYAGQLFGVTEETGILVETLYLEFLQALNLHLTEYPYLLGWKPSIGDFGLIAPLYAHLGRDPAPLRLMQQRALRVARWVERMNRADQDAAEFFNPGDDYLPDDSIPETLVAVLKVLAEDLVPETYTAAAVINQWLADNQPEPGTSAQGLLGHRMFGMAEFNLRGQSISAVAQSYRFVILQKLQQQYAQWESAQQQEVTDLLQRCGLESLLDIKLDRELGWSENQDIWL
ncbi:glutathione S-transferase N-terminal domain-containing protein [Porticoccaceae bacterium]|nr:glutathione S-transferase N-terminal domain-containing protein [Porticoccaceae bacterium]MDC0010930.1 glutathione S-transferase N-terminal domain-containing protein [Porticoccaceae bacterium]MDC1453559.1 glutathione S-transferase N-terminal domain-containing protein [Porticoccaceae bacterium]